MGKNREWKRSNNKSDQKTSEYTGMTQYNHKFQL